MTSSDLQSSAGGQAAAPQRRAERGWALPGGPFLCPPWHRPIRPPQTQPESLGPGPCTGAREKESLTEARCPHLHRYPKESSRPLDTPCPPAPRRRHMAQCGQRGPWAQEAYRKHQESVSLKEPHLLQSRPSTLTALGPGQPSVSPGPRPRWGRAQGPHRVLWFLASGQ